MACGCDLKEVLVNFLTAIITYGLGIFWTLFLIGKVLIYDRLTGNAHPPVASKVRSPPAILNDPQFGEHGYLTLKNGLKIHYVAKGSNDKPLMLFLHGFPDFWFGWRHQIGFFSKNYRVVAIDMRGYGDSDKPSSVYAYALPNLVEDIRLVIEALERKSCILVSHDWGAIVAWTFATVHPEMVERLVCMNCPHPEAFQKYIRTSFKQFLKSWYIFVFQLPCVAEMIWTQNDMARLEAAYTKPPMGAKSGTFSSEEIEAYKFTFGKSDAFTPPVNYYRNIFRFFPPKRPVWRHLPMPVLVVFGTGDQALSTEAAVMSGEFVDGYFEVKLLDGVSHWVQHEAPDQVNQTVEQFLEKNVPPHHKAHWND